MSGLRSRFSALQRAEIAEIVDAVQSGEIFTISFSALQRAEIAEISLKASGTLF